MEYLFKATNGNQATHGGTYLYRKGQWTRHEPPVLCESGWHLARGKQVLEWLAPTLWLAEIHPDAVVVEGDNKIVVSKMRIVERLHTWNDRTARLFACDCADDALALKGNPDPRSVEAVAVARRFADGDATRAELAAAGDAAWAAARDAAGDAAWAAARAAAWAAAGDAARAAAGDAAGDAARAAAGDAAWAAARAAAWAAAGDAARDAAGDAAGDAARAAARAAQYRRLLGYLELEAN